MDKEIKGYEEAAKRLCGVEMTDEEKKAAKEYHDTVMKYSDATAELKRRDKKDRNPRTRR